MEIIGLHFANRLVICYSTVAGMLLTSFPTFPMLCAVVFISFDPLWRAWMANCLEKTLKWSKPLQPGSRHLAFISCVLGCKPCISWWWILRIEIDPLEVWIWFVVRILFSNGHEIKKVTAAYAMSCEFEFDVRSNKAGMIFYNKLLGMRLFQIHIYIFLFNALMQVCLRNYEECRLYTS